MVRTDLLHDADALQDFDDLFLHADKKEMLLMAFYHSQHDW